MRLPVLPGYRYDELLGEDPFGWSFLASHQGGEKRLIRVLKAQATNDTFIYQLLRPFIDANFSIKGVAEIYDLVFQSDQSLTVMAQPFYGWQGKESKEWQETSLQVIRTLISQDQTFAVVKDLANSLDLIHRCGSFHGGLRPGNVYVTKDPSGGQQVKIGDFGQAFIAGTQYLEAGDILFYASPEQLASGDYSADKGRAWDVYAFGVIAFQLLTGHLPRLDRLYQQCTGASDIMDGVPAISYGQLTEASEHFARQLVREQSVEWPEDAKSSEEEAIRPVIEGCLAFEAVNRYPNMAEVSAAIVSAIKNAKPREESVAKSSAVTAVTEKVSESASSAKGRKKREKKVRKKISIPKWNVSGALSRTISDRRTLAWQVAAVLAILALIPVGLSSIINYYRWKDESVQKTIVKEELQADVEDQAEQYRAALTQKTKSSERLKSELDEAEDSKSRMEGEATLARQILRQTQDNGDQFFRLILDNRDTDVPEFKKRRAEALREGRKHYERLVEVYGNAPDFIESTANAMFYLGEIYRETGEFGKALASYTEAERRYLALMPEGQVPKLFYLKNLARAKRSLGELSMKNGRYSSAMNFFSESSAYLRAVRKYQESETLTASTGIQENSLAIIECERILNNVDAALDGSRSIGVQLLQMQEQNPDDDRVIAALAKSFSIGGRVLEDQGQGEKAIEAYQQASNLYAKAVKLNSAVDDYQLGLGNSLARVGLLKNDLEKLQAASDVLAKVIPSNPYEPVYQKTLAEVFGVMARNQRDGGQPKKAIELEEKAVSILSPVIRGNEATPMDVKYSYALRLAHLAELKGDAGDFDDSRQPLQEAIDVLAGIANAQNSQPNFRRALARAQGLAGFACIKSGDKEKAKQHYELAQAEWETYVSQNPGDTDAIRAAQWTKEQLKGL